MHSADLLSWAAACGLFVCTAVALATTVPAAPNGLDAILPKNAKLEKVAGGMKFIEGPVWDGSGGVVFSDIPADTLYRFTTPVGEGQALPVFRNPSGEANGNTRDRQGRLISCEHKNRRVSRTEKDGMVVTLAYAYQNKRLNSPNDIVVKSDGTLFFTDPPYGLPNQTVGKELDFNGVYRIDKDGSLTLLVADFERPNGLAFSPDERRLYVNDSQRGHIRVFDVQADGTLANGRVFAELKEPGARGVPDGMKVDKQGNVYCTGPGGVWVFAPTGMYLGRIATLEVSANCGWGDRDGKTLYITASTGLYRIRTKIGGALPGPTR